jgi:hypothetical protein
MLNPAPVILAYKFRFTQYITFRPPAHLVKSLCFYHTFNRGYTLHSASIIAYRSHYRHTVHTIHSILTLTQQALAIQPSGSEFKHSWLHSGALMLISTAQSLGCQKLLSRVALASLGSADKHYQKNLRRRLRLERVVGARLVIPCWGEGLVCCLRIWNGSS